MGWQAFREMEHTQLRDRREGLLRRALGLPLLGESVEELDRIADIDLLRAELGLVALMAEDGNIYYDRLADLGRHDMRARTAAERVQVEWLEERLECQRKGESAPPIPAHLLG